MRIVRDPKIIQQTHIRPNTHTHTHKQDTMQNTQNVATKWQLNDANKIKDVMCYHIGIYTYCPYAWTKKPKTLIYGASHPNLFVVLLYLCKFYIACHGFMCFELEIFADL
jgi:hypothetical protein